MGRERLLSPGASRPSHLVDALIRMPCKLGESGRERVDGAARHDGAGHTGLHHLWNATDVREFLGRFDEMHDMKLPQGPVQFPVNGSAVRCMNGHGILEFSWYDIDPSRFFDF